MLGSIVIDNEVIVAIPESGDKTQFVQEAALGFNFLKPYIDQLKAGDQLLEVGSGPAVLAAHIAKQYPALHIQGVEPVGSGFSTFEQSLESLVEKRKLKIKRGGFENFDSLQKFDLIFLINVFEHFQDWRAFLPFLNRYLSPQGRCIIMCPNYSFPYEPHFGIPVIVNKAITHGFFKNHIQQLEEKRNWQGLWDSLNFIKWPVLSRELRAAGLQVRFNAVMTRSMVERLESDAEFRKRQKLIGAVARLVLKMGVFKILECRAFHRFHPYMQLEITRGAT